MTGPDSLDATPAAGARLGVLGPVAALGADGSVTEPSGSRAKSFLVALALAAPRPLSAERLVDEVWQEEPPRGARAALQTLVSRIRTALGDEVIASSPSGYRLGLVTDLHDAEGLLNEARELLAAERFAEASTTSHYALALWRGDPGADLAPEPLASALATRAAHVQDGLETAAAVAALALGVAMEAETLARGLCARSPFDDSAHLLLMRALDELGRPTEALGVFADFRERVQDAFGTSPALELQSLHLELLDRGETHAARGGRAPGTNRDATPGAGTRPGAGGSSSAADGSGAGAPSGDTAVAGSRADDASRAESVSGAGARPGAEGRAAAGAGTGSATPTGPAGTAKEWPSPAGRTPDAAPALAVSFGIRAAPNELLGRDEALTDIESLLSVSRVTTVLGPGGLGKTRVAHEVARRSLTAFALVVVVELASVRTPEDIVFALGSALGIREVATSKRLGDQRVRDDLRSRILTRLGGGPALLVLDNCEHLVDAAAEWCAELTAELPALTVLTTSRTPLAISSERSYALPPLGGAQSSTAGRSATGRSTTRDGATGVGASARGPAPSVAELADDPAVRLFVDRATAARPGAVLPLETVARLCGRLEGLPLAIELAAARIRSLSLDEVERRLGNRFALLTGGDRSAPARHRTLLAVIEWSWNLLDTAEQRALCRLSEFTDGFSAEAAAVVVAGAGPDARGPDAGGLGTAEDIDEVLDGLVAQSLVMVREDGRSGLRYRMLETVREFGQLQLDRQGARDQVQDALFAWADGFSAEQTPGTDGPLQVATFAAVEVEEDNLIDVMRRAIDAERPDVVVSVFALLGYYWTLRSAHSEVIAFSRPVFESIRSYSPADDRVEATAATLLMAAGTTMLLDTRFAVRPLSKLRALLRGRPLRNPRLTAMAGLLLTERRPEALTVVVDAMLASAEPQTVLLGSLVGSMAAENDGRRADAIALAHRGERAAAALDDTWGGAMAGQMLGQLHSQGADPVEALRWARKARVGLARLGAHEDLRQLEWLIATNLVVVGELDEASELFDRLISSPGPADGVEVLSMGLAGQAQILRAEGRFAEARLQNLDSLAAFDTPSTRASPWFRIVLASALATMVLDGTGTQAERADLARRLRARTLATIRMSRAYVDQPVLGAAVIGLAVWLEEVAHASGRSSAASNTQPGDGPDADSGVGALPLELLALAEHMGGRQDLPALHLAPLFERFARSYPPEQIAAARIRAGGLAHAERPERVAELLRAPGPWSPERMPARPR